MGLLNLQKRIKLDARLQMLAELIAPDRKIVDVGTDHGFLPAFMLLQGLNPYAIASDVSKMPLLNAKRTIEKYNLQEKVDLILSDGLENIPKEKAEEIIIAGMGGTLIVDILSKAPWLKQEGRHLILQPMTRANELRLYLCKNGFYIDKETAVLDNKKPYAAISAYWNGQNKDFPPWYFHFGELIKEDNIAAKAFLHKHKNSLVKRRDAIRAKAINVDELKNLNEILTYYKEHID